MSTYPEQLLDPHSFC